MQIYLSNELGTAKAEGNYNIDAKSMTVKAGARVSESISDSKIFGGVNKIIKLRKR